jgi:DNA-binding beta-propeller fold protein YncE
MLLVLALQLWVSAPLWAQAVITTIQVDDGPRAVAVNERTNRSYVANEFGATVSVIQD